MERITSVRVMEGHRVRVGLSGGGTREIDLTSYLRGPVFDEIRRDPVKFGQVRVDPQLGTLVWPNGADVCPDVLVLGRTPARPTRGARPKSRR